MSDPVTNVEIEDVLSSIRRLVSEDVRPKPPAPKPEASQRLVLTPAQRVTDDPSPSEDATCDVPGDEAAGPDAARPAPMLLTDPAPDPAPPSPSAEAAPEPTAAPEAEDSAPENPVAGTAPDEPPEQESPQPALSRMVEAEVRKSLRDMMPAPDDTPSRDAAETPPSGPIPAEDNPNGPDTFEYTPRSQREDAQPTGGTEGTDAVRSLRLRLDNPTPRTEAGDPDWAGAPEDGSLQDDNADSPVDAAPMTFARSIAAKDLPPSGQPELADRDDASEADREGPQADEAHEALLAPDEDHQDDDAPDADFDVALAEDAWNAEIGGRQAPTDPEASRPEDDWTTEDEERNADMTAIPEAAAEADEDRPPLHEDAPAEDGSIPDEAVPTLTFRQEADPDPDPETQAPRASDPQAAASPTVAEAPDDLQSPEAADGMPADVSPDATLESKVAALERIVGETGQTFEPDGDDDQEAAADPMPWQDHVDDAAEPPERDNVLPGPTWQEPRFQHRPPEEAAPTLTDDDAPLIDEDMLRDMVAEIVRQELQGALGERITRNVRKLVRREIHRALLTQEFD